MKQTSDIHIHILMFIVTLGCAWYYQWKITDIIWALWISSLTLGYSYILVSIAGLFHKNQFNQAQPTGAERKKPFPMLTETGCQGAAMSMFFIFVLIMISGFSRLVWYVLPFVILSIILSVGSGLRAKKGWEFFPDPEIFIVRFFILLPMAGFYFAFFTIHFMGFHFVHGIFLNGFFPLIKATPFGKTIPETGIFFLLIIRKALTSYWPFVVSSALSRLPDYAEAFKNQSKGPMMFKPYLNVIRMHIMIFVFAFLRISGIESFALYVVLIVYFLPIMDIIKWIRSSRQSPK